MNGIYGTPDLNEEYKDTKELYDYLIENKGFK
jgi:hypothetical protein